MKKVILTKRETEVLELLIEGYENDQIADALSITKSTVKKHLEAIFKKMNVYNRVQASVTYLKIKFGLEE